MDFTVEYQETIYNTFLTSVKKGLYNLNTLIINNKEIVIIIILSLLLLMCSYLYNKDLYEIIIPKHYFILDESYLNKVHLQLLQDSEIKKTEDQNVNSIRFLSGYNEGESELKNIPDVNKFTFIAGIKGMDYLAGKNYLWAVLSEFYSLDTLQNLVPRTYLLNDTKSIKNLLNDKSITNDTIFILKKNVQRQEGLFLTTRKQFDANKLINFKDNDYVIIQEYLKDPFIIDKRKINIRVYLLLVLRNENLKVYMYNDGFLYYTNGSYEYSTDPNCSITTGLLDDRSVYKRNPLTIQDLFKNLDNGTYNSNGKVYSSKVLQKNIEDNLTKIVIGTKRYFKGHQNTINYQLFGCDIQPDTDLNVKLIEINKNSSLTPKDPRDSELKANLQRDTFNIIGLTNSTEQNGFINIL